MTTLWKRFWNWLFPPKVKVTRLRPWPAESLGAEELNKEFDEILAYIERGP